MIHSQKQKTAQIVDQNFATNILFMALSSMESLSDKLIEKYNEGKSNKKYNEKEFAGYDKYDYSAKSINEIKDQLNNHVFIFANSRMAF